MVGTDGHKRAEKWVAQKLSEIGCEPYSGKSYALPYEREGISFTNFAGSIACKDRDLPPILIGAHYDSVISAPCADDNGAAVAITLAVGEAAAAPAAAPAPAAKKPSSLLAGARNLAAPPPPPSG